MTRRGFIAGIVVLIVSLLFPLLVNAQDGGTRPAAYKLDLSRLRHEYQGWNNCGPTTLTMGLTYFGYGLDQYPAAAFLKPNREDKNVSPAEMVQYVNDEASQLNSVRALYRPGGTLELLKTLLAADLPVIVEKGYEPEGYDWMGHYLLLIGYDDAQAIFYTYDSFSGHGNLQGLRESYEHVEHYWWHFNNTFIVLYPPEREAEVMTLLGDRADLANAYQLAAVEAQARAQANQNDAWAWFNIADALTELGQYEQAVPYFQLAIEKGLPWRTLWYRFTPFTAFYETGHFQTVLELVAANEANTPYVEEWYYYNGLVFASRGLIEPARAQFQQALVYNSNYQLAQDALTALDNGSFQPVVEVPES